MSQCLLIQEIPVSNTVQSWILYTVLTYGYETQYHKNLIPRFARGRVLQYSLVPRLSKEKREPGYEATYNNDFEDDVVSSSCDSSVSNTKDAVG